MYLRAETEDETSKFGHRFSLSINWEGLKLNEIILKEGDEV